MVVGNYQPGLAEGSPSETLLCEWMTPPCSQTFSDPESLYLHLCDHHIGRKSTGNLTLRCHWKNCEAVCVKRDHITSHLRVHTPLKPHSCEVCGKAFKRPQDLKKHERIHTEEHHLQHRHSKAVTAPISGQRVGATRQYAPLPQHAHPHSVHSSPHSPWSCCPGQIFTGLSTVQLVQQQQELNSRNLTISPQVATTSPPHQAYDSVLPLSPVAPLNPADGISISGTAPPTGFFSSPYNDPGASLFNNPYPQIDLCHLTQANKNEVAYPPLNGVEELRPGIPATASNHADRPLDNSTWQNFSNDRYPYVSERTSSPLSNPSINYARSSLSPSQTFLSSPASSASEGPTRSRGSISQSLRNPSFSSVSCGGQKREFDDVTSDLFSKLKRGKHDDCSDEVIARLAKFLSPGPDSNLPQMDRYNSFSDESSASSPPSLKDDMQPSLTPSSDFEWLAEKTEADKLTDLLATIGNEIETSTAAAFAGNWPDNFPFNFAMPSVEPMCTKPRVVGSFPTNPNSQAFNFSSMSMLPNQSAGHANTSLPIYPTVVSSTYPALPALYATYPPPNILPQDPQMRVSKPLAPPQLSASSNYPTMNFQKVNPLQRAPPTSNTYPSTESLTSPSLRHQDLTEPSASSAERTNRKSGLELAPLTPSKSNQYVGTTLPPLRTLFGSTGSGPHASSSASVPSQTNPVSSYSYPRLCSHTQTSIYPSLASLTASLSRIDDEPQSSAGDRPSTADSLTRSIRGMNLMSRRASVASMRSTSSPPTIEESIPESGGESGFEDNLEALSEDGQDLPHKRSRLSHASPRPSPVSALSAAEQEKLDYARRQLAIVHELIVKVNAVHRAMSVKRRPTGSSVKPLTEESSDVDSVQSAATSVPSL